MPQETFIPAVDGSSTHLDARNVINNNANDAESRISNLETRLDLETHDINSSYGEGETFYFGGSSYRVNDGATLNVGESPTTNPEKVTLLDNAGGSLYATSFNGPHSLGDDRNPSASLGTVTVDVGLSYQVGDYIIVSMVPRPDSFDIAKVTAYDSATGVMSFDNISQSTVDSESTDWNINLTGKPASDVIYSTSFNGPHSITEDRNQANAGNGLGPVTVGTGLSYIGGELIIVSGDPLPENYQIAQVVSYDSDTGVMEWDHIESSTIYSNSQNWNINLTGKIGPAGADGDSAYEVAVSEGFVGNEAAWLASLVGADGATGPAGADGAENATLDSVTTNGATTLNDIGVGRIATLHPTNSVNHNIATGSSSASIGGTANQATGNRAGTFGGRSNEVSGNDSSSFGGLDQVVKGHESEAFGGTNIALNTKYTNTVGGANHVIGLATSGSSTHVAKHSITVGGENSIIENAIQTAIVGGVDHKIQTGHDRSVIIGGTGITTDAADTVYVQNLNVGAGFKMPTGASNTYVLTSDANGVGTWQAAAGGPAGPSGTVLSGTTANATPTEIFVDGTSPNRVDVATGSTITFSALVAARSATESAGYKIEGVIKNDAGTAALVGVVAKTVFAEEDIAWDITVTAANNALTFIVTGDSADSVSWEVTLNKTEAT